MAVLSRGRRPGRSSELDRRLRLKDGTVNKAESSCLKSSYPTLRPPWTLCPQLFHPPARTRRRDKRGSPRTASLPLTAQGSDYSSMLPLCTKSPGRYPVRAQFSPVFFTLRGLQFLYPLTRGLNPRTRWQLSFSPFTLGQIPFFLASSSYTLFFALLVKCVEERNLASKAHKPQRKDWEQGRGEGPPPQEASCLPNSIIVCLPSATQQGKSHRRKHYFHQLQLFNHHQKGRPSNQTSAYN